MFHPKNQKYIKTIFVFVAVLIIFSMVFVYSGFLY